MNTPKAREKNPAAVELGRLGGKARAKALTPKQTKAIAAKALKAAMRAREKMSPERRRGIARKAAAARWAKARKAK